MGSQASDSFAEGEAAVYKLDAQNINVLHMICHTVYGYSIMLDHVDKYIGWPMIFSKYVYVSVNNHNLQRRGYTYKIAREPFVINFPQFCNDVTL